VVGSVGMVSLVVFSWTGDASSLANRLWKIGVCHFCD
jgi:hypothetical protein